MLCARKTTIIHPAPDGIHPQVPRADHGKTNRIHPVANSSSDTPQETPNTTDQRLTDGTASTSKLTEQGIRSKPTCLRVLEPRRP